MLLSVRDHDNGNSMHAPRESHAYPIFGPIYTDLYTGLCTGFCSDYFPREPGIRFFTFLLPNGIIIIARLSKPQLA